MFSHQIINSRVFKHILHNQLVKNLKFLFLENLKNNSQAASVKQFSTT